MPAGWLYTLDSVLDLFVDGRSPLANLKKSVNGWIFSEMLTRSDSIGFLIHLILLEKAKPKRAISNEAPSRIIRISNISEKMDEASSVVG